MRYIFLFLFACFSLIGSVFADETVTSDPNIRNVEVGSSWDRNSYLETIKDNLSGYFFDTDNVGGEGITSFFVTVAYNIKNLFISIAVIFLMVGVMKLLFSPGSEESVKKWRSNIIWVSVGVILMQMAYSFWNVLILKSDETELGSRFGWDFFLQIFQPIIGIMLMLASFGFIAMMIYAFYIIVTGGGDEEKLKKWKNTVIYAVIGFLLIRLPEAFVRAIYGSPACKKKWLFEIGSCEIKNNDLTGVVEIIGKIFVYFNGFLTLICVLLVIYAWWLVFISGGDEEKLKKAKNIVLYIIIGLVLLVASHAIFQFFILRG